MKTKEKKTRSARDRIKPRGLWGCMKDRIHYESDDIFNLGMPDGLPEEVALLKAGIAKEPAQAE
ncbi:MAG: hypothetical protein LBF39_03145 [Prevotellaceae bacterium]|nr:hypothetical protein [Prevotellaceae bacterium]